MLPSVLLPSSGLIWPPLASSDLIRAHRTHLASSGLIWPHLASSELIYSSSFFL